MSATIQTELAALRTRWEQAGGNPTEFNSWEPGETYDEFLTRCRTDCSDLESNPRAA